ncbi:MAG TPA: hypothetical protein VFG98_13210 [Intrasporangium sp.]|nr:hypothetical protein [Intrasporangium sp.]
MTPNKHDDLGSDLGQAMRDQVEGLGGAGLTLDDVKGTASRIRRRQAWTAGAAIAAVLAIAVPTALTTTGGLGDPDRNQTPATTTPSQTTTPKQVGAPGQPLDTRDLPLGAEPHVTWLEGTTLHPAGSDPVPLERQYTQVSPYDDGWLALWNDEGTPSAELLDADGEPKGEPFGSAYTMAVSEDRERVLYVEDGALRMHDNSSGETETLRAGLGPETEVVGVSDGPRYIAHYNVSVDGNQQARWFADGQDHVARPNAQFYGYNAVSGDGWVTATTSVSDTGSCSELLADDATVARTCDFTLRAVGPDRKHVLAGPAYADGYADGELAVLATDGIGQGHPQLHFLQTGQWDAAIMDSVWEGSSHVLVVTATPIEGTSDRMFGVVRVGLDGAVENAVEPVRAPEFGNPFALMTFS